MADIDCERLERIVAMISNTIKIVDDAGQPLIAALLTGALDRASAASIEIGCD